MGSRSDSKGLITRRRTQTSRGQTTLDFAIGMSIFLAVVIFIFLFIPGILSPFTQGSQADTASSNRVADQLANGALGSPSEPYVLDRFCTVQFFQGATPSQCSYSGATLEDQLGLDETFQSVNITIRTNATATETLCWESTDGLVEETGPDCGGTQLHRGDTLTTSSDDTVTSQRVVSLDGEDVALYVRMW